MFLAVPVGRDELRWNEARIYGRRRMELLVSGWDVEDSFGFYWEDMDNRGTGVQPVFVLRKSAAVAEAGDELEREQSTLETRTGSGGNPRSLGVGSDEPDALFDLPPSVIGDGMCSLLSLDDCKPDNEPWFLSGGAASVGKTFSLLQKEGRSPFPHQKPIDEDCPVAAMVVVERKLRASAAPIRAF